MSPRAADPEIAAMLADLPIAGGGLDERTLPAMRSQRAALVAGIELSDAVERSDHTVPGRDGAPNVTVRVHRPRGATGLLPCVYSIHGGGYVLGTYEMDDLRFDHWCRNLGVVGVSVDYRLAPETPYPGPLDDCYAGLAWTFAHAAELGVDPDRIGVSGASAGGGLAAGLALLARDRGELSLAFQLLIYPMVDDRQVTVSSRLEEVPIWNPGNNAFGWRCYLGDLYGTDAVPPYAAASRATDLAGLPPAFVCVGTLDGFCDEDIVYAQRLIAADVPTELHVYPGAPHAFDAFTPAATLARRCRRDMEEWLSAQLRGAA
ncbi:MAG TPA: alpha/beta hydrolase [Acidimicrobiales bacterium]|nr:alpha/beta hydrolase [Acidimicrobiales bacterium]